MGWGYYLEARKNHGTDHEERKELIYWHKFDALYHAIHHEIRYEAPGLVTEGTPEVVLTKENLVDILHELENLPDYWADYEGDVLVPDVQCSGGFQTVERLCEIIYLYDSITANGWEIVFFRA